MSRIRIKICGVTDSVAITAAVARGVDALGFNFYESSPRYLTQDKAKDLLDLVPAMVTRVGVFVDADAGYVRESLQHLQLDQLQFHADESADYCRQFDRPYIKAIRAISPEEIASQVAAYPDAAAILVDSVKGGQFGGTGQTFDWQLLPLLEVPLIVAGGLHADNVAELIKQFRPFAVDVSGGVESVKGEKDVEKISAFVDAVRRADEEYR